VGLARNWMAVCARSAWRAVRAAVGRTTQSEAVDASEDIAV
jgi:hypothetical protein